MAETSSSESAIGKFVGTPISAALGAYVAWVTAGSTGSIGSALVHLVAIGGGICGLVFGLIYTRNLGVLGAGGEERDTPERQAYEALRKSLAEGNLAARLYTRRLTAFLDAVDRFFGDAMHLGQRAFGLRMPAPLWTAPAMDRCLLLALIYPIFTILLIWTISGHLGPAEEALHLPAGASVWKRSGYIVWLGFMTFAFMRSPRLSGWRGFLWLAVASVGTIAVALAFAGGFVDASGSSGAVILPFAVALAFAGAFGGAKAIAFAVAVALGFAVTLGFAVAVAVAFAVQWISNMSVRRRWQGLFLSLFLTLAILACLVAARLLPSGPSWKNISPPLLFLGLLTLVNAPFDWASLGLTRALLRRGLELGGWWPYFLAVVDAALAAVIIVGLALTMVVVVQAFDALAVHGGGSPVLPLDALFNGIAAHPTAPEYWWFYALLLSTMIPSLVNLVIGGASLLRGIPGLPALMLPKLPVARAVPAFDRAWIATVLTLQTVGGGLLGIAAQVLLVWVMIGYIMPFFGPELLEMAQDLAAFSLPAHVGQLFGVSL